MTEEQRYDLLFRGDIAPGRRLDQVRAQVQELFQIDDDRAARLFSGRPTIIRRDLDAAGAERYRAALAAAGALVELRPVAGVVSETPPAGEPAADDWTLAPLGVDVLRPEERREPEAVRVDIDHLTVEPVGADVLRAEERRAVPKVDIDTSRLGLDPATD
jgi:hypothetical protein